MYGTEITQIDREAMEFVEIICAMAAPRCEERDGICRCDPYLESCRQSINSMQSTSYPHNDLNVGFCPRLDGANVRRGIVVRPPLGQLGRVIGVVRQEYLGIRRQAWSKQGREVGEAYPEAENRLQDAGDHC